MIDAELEAALVKALEENLTGEPSDIVEFAEDKLARKINSVISDLDDLCAMASNPDTAGLVEAEQISMGQINTRIQLILSFLMARKPAPTHIRRVS